MISGLVVHLNSPNDAATLAVLRRDAQLDLGQLSGNRLPVVIEAASPAECHEITDQLNELAGVAHVDVVFVDLESNQDSCQENESR